MHYSTALTQYLSATTCSTVHDLHNSEQQGPAESTAKTHKEPTLHLNWQHQIERSMKY